MKRAPIAADSNDTSTNIMGHVTSAMGTVNIPVKTQQQQWLFFIFLNFFCTHTHARRTYIICA